MLRDIPDRIPVQEGELTLLYQASTDSWSDTVPRAEAHLIRIK
jgi:hypothetical protein